MKTITKSLLVGGAALLAVTVVFAKSSTPPNKETVHYSVKITLTNGGSAKLPSGTAQATSTMQGNSDHESLSVTVQGLDSDTTYDLSATTNGTPTIVDTFTTDKKGDAKVTLKNTGKTGDQYPPALDPLYDVTEFDIQAGASNVLTGTTANTITQGTYMVNKTETENGVTGTLSVKASTASKNGPTVSVTASGLSTDDEYVLDLDDTPVETNAPSSKGDLKFSTSYDNILGLDSVSITDTNDITEWSTTVP